MKSELTSFTILNAFYNSVFSVIKKGKKLHLRETFLKSKN